MPMIITLPDDIAQKLQTEADARQQSINDCAIDFLERALESESFDTQSDFKMLAAQMRATRATPDLRKGEKAKGRKGDGAKENHNDDASDFEKIGDKIKSSPPSGGDAPTGHRKEAQGRGGAEASRRGGEEAKLSSGSSFSSPDKGNEQDDSNFKKLDVQPGGRASAMASTGWLLDPSVSPINDHKYRLDLEQWSSIWGKVKIKMKYEQPPS